MENETVYRSRVQHESEHDVALRGGPAGFIGGADVRERRLSERLAREAESARRTKIASALLAMRRCSSQSECAPILAAFYQLGLTSRERMPVIRAMRAQGFTESDIIAALWHIESEQDPGYEKASMECRRIVETAE